MTTEQPTNETPSSLPLHPLADLYQRWALDFVVEAARAISQDYAKEPMAYRRVPDDVGAVIESFSRDVGADRDWPSFAERNAVYDNQLGVWFSDAAAAFRLAIVAHVEKAGGNRLARGAMHEAIMAFRAQLHHRKATPLERRQAQATAMFDAAVLLLRSEHLAQLYNASPVPAAPWPFMGMLDRDAADFVQAIAERLFPPIEGRMSQYKFLLLQRVAHSGALTLSLVLDDELASDEDRYLDSVLAVGYGWCLGIRELVPVSTVVSAWKREIARITLTEFAKSHMPHHPAGDIELTGTELQQALGPSRPSGRRPGDFGRDVGVQDTTWTFSDTVCCSTGDLGCVTDWWCFSVVEHCPTEGGCPTDPGSGLSCGNPCGSPHHHC